MPARAAQAVKVLYDDGNCIIVRYRPDVEDVLIELGFELALMEDTPMVINRNRPGDRGERALPEITYNKKEEEMIGKVSEGTIKSHISALCGETPITVGGTEYVLTNDNDIYGDQHSFWRGGIPAIWVIEDDQGSYNSNNMHTEKDTPGTLKSAYYTAITKAVLGTAAHFVNPL